MGDTLTAAKILIVDDDPDTRSFFSKALRSLGFDVEAAKDGHQGSRLWKVGRQT